MSKAIKLLLWLFAGISSLLAVLVALLYLVDVNLYRAQIEQRVSTAFGREIVFSGTLSLEPSLTPRFAINGFKISNPQWASRLFLATVKKFEIRVSLLPLLRGELQIVSLEFHGVDLQLEKNDDGRNNLTFGASGTPTALPAIEHMALHDVSIAYAAGGDPVRQLHLEEVTARKLPDQLLELEIKATVNTLPATISLRGQPTDDSRPHSPWQISALGEAGALSLRLEGSVGDPSDWRQGDYRLKLNGPQLTELETLTGTSWPVTGPIDVQANFGYELDDHLHVGEFSARVGTSDLNGKLHWDMAAPRPALRVRLDSQQLDAAEWGMGDLSSGDDFPAAGDAWDRPLEIDTLAAVDLDIDVRVGRLLALAEQPLQDVVLRAHSDRQQLALTAAELSVDDSRITASAALPWGERLADIAKGTVSLETLLQHAELDLHAQAPPTAHHYAVNLMGHPLDLAVTDVTASARPGVGLKIEAAATLNTDPITATLQGEPLAVLARRATGPWQQLELQLQGQGIRLDASGSLAKPLSLEGVDISYSLKADDIATLLPLQGALSLSGHYTDLADGMTFDKLEVTLGRSDMSGRIQIHTDEPRPRLVADLDARRIDLEQLLPQTGGDAVAFDWNQPLEIGAFADADLDVEVEVRRLEGLEKPVQDIHLRAQAGPQTLTLAPLAGRLDGIPLDAHLQLPWGERLTDPGGSAISVRRLAQQTRLDLKARPPEQKLRYGTQLVGQAVDLGLGEFEVAARPGERLQVNAQALLNDKPLAVKLGAEPLAALLQRSDGPWRDLSLEIRGDDIRFQATGSVAQPMEARGFDIDYALQGDEIEALLPLFNLLLSLEGPYSLTGHFADLPDRNLFDKLRISSGGSDIGGRISVYPGEQRPKVVANLNSEQLYLSKLLPVNKTGANAAAEGRVIPDYELPIEYLQAFDGELKFKGKRLRTTAGDLGDIAFRATLNDGVFKLDPFRVRGWAGAFVESELAIDTTQNPPTIALEWIARELSYGVLLEQAGFAETVEGTLDITLRLSASGRSRYEILGNANGQLIIVGREGRFGSRRLDLWGSDLVTTMLSPAWHSEDVTDLNCLVARIDIKDGVASSDALLVDTRRITIGATGTLNLESEALNLVIAPRPRRTSLVSLANPVHVTGTLAAPKVAVTVLPRNRVAAAGTGALAGLINPGYLIFTFTRMGSRQTDACSGAVERAMELKGGVDQDLDPPTDTQPRFPLFPGCTRAGQRRIQ